MHKRDYEKLAQIVGETLGAAYASSGERNRTVIYEALYRPMVALMNADNPRFNHLSFAAAVVKAEAEYMNTVRVGLIKMKKPDLDDYSGFAR